MNIAYLLLGSNLGSRESFLAEATSLIRTNTGAIVAASSLYNTAAWGNPAQGDFLNQAVCINTNLSAFELLEKLLAIEEQLGRKRLTDSDRKKWEARTIDIDILFFNSEIIETQHLTIPHPFLHERNFALIPLTEIAGDFIHPVFKKSIKKLLTQITDTLEVHPVIIG